MNRPVDALTAAVAQWVNQAVLRLNQEQLTIAHAALDQPGLDVRVVVQLRSGTVSLMAVDEGQRLETLLFREEVDPVRPDDGFAHDLTGGQHGRH